jgi:hypothetical protein
LKLSVSVRVGMIASRLHRLWRSLHMAAQNWQCQMYVGRFLTNGHLDGYGAKGWELAAVFPPRLSTIPVATCVVVAYQPLQTTGPGSEPSIPVPNAAEAAVAYDIDSYTYIFKQPA